MKMTSAEARNHAKRHNRIEVKVSDDEMEVIKKKAKAADLNISSYMRRIATVGEIRFFDLSRLRDLKNAVSAFGNNINQIAMVANSTGSVTQKELEEVVQNQKLVIGELNAYYKKLVPKVV